MIEVAAGAGVPVRDIAKEAGVRGPARAMGSSCVGDLNGDGLTDIVLNEHGSRAWPVMLQGPVGHWVKVFELEERDRHGCEIGDVAGVGEGGEVTGPDGRLDIVAVLGGNGGRSIEKYDEVWLQTDSGSFVESIARTGIPPTEGRGRDVVLFDMDNDGDLDAYFANEQSDTSDSRNHLYRNDGGYFVEIVHPLLTVERAGGRAVACDLTRDGWTDLIIGNPSRVLRNDSGDGWTDVSAALGLSNVWFHGFACGDFSGDGVIDVALITRTAVQVRKGANGKYAISFRRSISEGRGLAAGDIDGDRRPDLVVVNGKTNRDLLLKGPTWAATTLPHVTGDGDGVLAVPMATGRDAFLISNGYATTEGPRQLFVSP
jgi:hypothetical protein